MRAASVIAVAGLTACSLGQSGENIARAQAKATVNGIVAQRFPGVNAAPVTDCVIDNASMSEIYGLSRAAVTGVTPEAVSTVMTIAQRPAAMRCISANVQGMMGAA